MLPDAVLRWTCNGRGVKKLLGVAGALAAVAFGYRRFLRGRILDWGTTPEEATGCLPGDELLDRADLVATRAITIDASPDAVWPWLVQMGPGRGGAYTYDWIENLLGLDMHSTDRIHPEWQDLELGDTLGEGMGPGAMRVEILEPEETLAWRSADGTWVWTFVLVEREDGGTRLLSRNRIAMDGSLGSRVGMLVMEPGSLVMERKMLLGIKRRAEQLAAVAA